MNINPSTLENAYNDLAGMVAKPADYKRLREILDSVYAAGEVSGRNKAVDEAEYAIGIRDGKIIEVPRNFLQTVLDALEAARQAEV